MTAFSALKTELLQRVNDPGGQSITSTIAYRFINNALEDWTNSVEPLWRPYGWFVTAKQFRYDLPSDWVKPKTLMWYQNGADKEISYLSPKEFQREGYFAYRGAVANPEAFTIIDNDLWLGPAPGTTSNSSTLNGAVNSTSVATITVTDGTKFHTNGGIALVDSEQIMHQGISTNDLTLCLRGQGGTTAATHLTAATIYRCDLVANYFYVPPALSATTDVPAIEQRWQKALLYKAIGDCYQMLGRHDEAQAELQLYEQKKMEAKREVRKLQRDTYTQVYSPYE